MIYARAVSYANPPDDLEVFRAQKNDIAALQSVLAKTSPYVLSLCKTWARPPLDPGEIAQESLIRISKNLKTFRAGSAFFTWVYTVTYRTFLDRARKEKRRSSIAQMVPLDENSGVANSQNTEELADSLVGQELSKAFDSLDQIHAEVLIIIDVQGSSYEQAAKDLGIPVGTVRSRLSRARLTLKKVLISQGTFDEAGNVLLVEETT